jgi:3D (Asp-Asp-Asp) domain-containing protein
LAQEKRKKILLAKKESLKKKIAKKRKTKRLKGFGKGFGKSIGKRKLRVTATAYSSHGNQTDKTPFLAAWNNRIRPGMKIIAVSRDMLTKYGLRNGSKVKIGGLSGYYTVRDKMNKRYRKRIDIYMGMNRRKALRWGRRSVILYY